ncbi:MAG: hypothetical protein C4324_10040 [Blastocatellia bacterium]
MRHLVISRIFAAVVVFSVVSPFSVLAIGDGKKYFKQGLKYEVEEEWDKAAEAFALAVNENPKNSEYKLHLQRALFNASQMYMRKGREAAEQKDYQAGYMAFRKAYAFDPANELAKSEMARMLRLQEESEKKSGSPKSVSGIVPAVGGAVRPEDLKLPQKLEQLKNLPFPGGVNLTFIIKQLADDLDLNVLFDSESRLETRTIRIELKNVTAARALDYIFLQENLFFQRVGPRTILVASNTRRTNFQQLVLRTFYLANANPKDVKTVIQTAIPAQPGRTQTIVVEDAATNSLTIRDTAENIALFEKLISSLDKDRAEVVMDVAIYEVSKSDLLRLGNQIGSEAELNTLGGTTRGVVGLGGNELFGRIGRAAADVIPSAFGAGIVLPSSNLVLFQDRQNTKLLASTQIHAFNNEDSTARIGQRVPVRTAQFVTAANTSNNGVVSDVINYEQVGLTLKFKPIVFPNQDVQVAMEIESKDVISGGTASNPVFSERKIVGTARIQNNRTLLLASVAQDVESKGKSGLPLLGLVPILGRLFTAPSRDNRQVDVVIAITPRVIRAPAIVPEDLIERPSGSLATPTSGSVESMLIEEERQEFIAQMRRIPKDQEIQLPDQSADSAVYQRGTSTSAVDISSAKKTGSQPGPELSPIDAAPNALELKTVAMNAPAQANASRKTLLPEDNNSTIDGNSSVGVAELLLPAYLRELSVGERLVVPIMVKTSTPFRSAVIGIRFDSAKIAVRKVSYGDVFGPSAANTPATPFLNQDGKTFISLSPGAGITGSGFGIIAYLEIEALRNGRPEIAFEKDVLNILSADGKTLQLRF